LEVNVMDIKRILETMSYAVVIALMMGGISVAEPIGDWNMNANGWLVTLNIASVDAQGKLAGTMSEGGIVHNIVGSWNEDQKKIVFMRIRDPQNPAVSQLFIGYFFQTPRVPGAGDNVVQYLTGYFEEATGAIGGWYAQREIVG
jgi:hypothetical protein